MNINVVLIFGNMYAYRVRIIEQLLKLGIKTRIFGWPGPFMPKDIRSLVNPPIYGAEKARKLYGARIVLNCFHYAEIESVNCKYFEIGGIGAFQLCDYKQCLDEYSPVDSRKYSFQTMDKCMELIKYYLDRPDERNVIADTHKEHFVLHHTYEHRINKILDIIS
jgi:spore maturation protein CgeB